MLDQGSNLGRQYRRLHLAAARVGPDTGGFLKRLVQLRGGRVRVHGVAGELLVGVVPAKGGDAELLVVPGFVLCGAEGEGGDALDGGDRVRVLAGLAVRDGGVDYEAHFDGGEGDAPGLFERGVQLGGGEEVVWDGLALEEGGLGGGDAGGGVDGGEGGGDGVEDGGEGGRGAEDGVDVRAGELGGEFVLPREVALFDGFGFGEAVGVVYGAGGAVLLADVGEGGGGVYAAGEGVVGRREGCAGAGGVSLVGCTGLQRWGGTVAADAQG